MLRTVRLPAQDASPPSESPADVRIPGNVGWWSDAEPTYRYDMKRLILLASVLLAVVLLAGCSSGAASSSTAIAPVPVAPMPGGAVPPASGDAAKSGTAATADRSVVATGSIDLTVDRPTPTADRVARLVDAAGGRVDGRTEQAPHDGDRGSATLTLRIPSAKLDSTVAALRKLGTVENVSISSHDVTADAEDLDARVTALRTSVDRLVDLMSRATSTADLITIETALSQRQADLESLESQKRSLDDQVDLATIVLRLGSVADAPPHVPATFASGLLAGWNAFVGFFAGALVVLGVLLPWIVLCAIIATVVVVLVRRARRISAR